MPPRKHVLQAIVSVAFILAMGAPVFAVRVDRVVGAASAGGSYFAKRFTVSAGTVVTGFEFVSNDINTVFPSVMVLTGHGERVDALHVAAEIQRVQPVSKHLVHVDVPPIAFEQVEDVFVAVELPPSTGVQGVGSGAGLGAIEQSGTSYLASALDGSLQSVDFDLCITLLYQGVGKTRATELVGPRLVSIAASPNPFNPSTTLTLGAPRPGFAQLIIYSVAGRAVRTLVHENVAAGIHERDWDGRDDQGHVVAAGIYVAQLELNQAVVRVRLLLVK